MELPHHVGEKVTCPVCGTKVFDLPPGAKPPVILTTAEVRRYFRKIIELEFPQLSVLSYQELSENLRIQPIARVSLARLKVAASA